MTSFFTPSDASKTPHDKVLIFGPTHAGKTDLTIKLAPSPLAMVDVENRAEHFFDRFNFLNAPVRDLDHLREILKELKSGKLACESFGLDSASAVYDALVVEFSRQIVKDGKPSMVTDYTSVNKRFAAMREFVFSIVGKDIFITAHLVNKYRMEGTQLKLAGTDFLADAKFRYAFDYIIRLEPTHADPRVSPPNAVFEKSASPHIKLGTKFKGLDRESFAWLKKGEKKLISTAPATIAASSSPAQQQSLIESAPTGETPAKLIEEIRSTAKVAFIYEGMLKNFALDVTRRSRGTRQAAVAELEQCDVEELRQILARAKAHKGTQRAAS